MPGYIPFPNETVTLTSHCAFCRNIDGEQNNTRLMLTNMRLVYEWSGRRRMGEDLSCVSYPLNELATQKDEIRVDCRPYDYETSFKLYPAEEEITFVFRSPEKNASRKLTAAWLDAISMAVTGTKSSAATALRRIVPGVEMLAGALKDTFDVVKTTFTGPSINERSASFRKTITTKCIGCRAPLSGRTGMTVQCKYCDTVQTL